MSVRDSYIRAPTIIWETVRAARLISPRRGLNASFNPLPRTRIAAQGFTYDVGQAGEYDVVLDYAQAEYTFNDYIGVRAGRIRRPEGIYNDIQDVDLARTWILLPQGMYDARWRDFYVNIDGGEIFGSIPLKKAGSLSYELYYGLQNPKLDGGLSLQKANLPPFSPLVSINSPQLGGGQLWWNTPLDGLRAGVALNYNRDLTFTTANGRQSVGSPFTQHYSLEYLWKSWTFQAEYLRFKINYENTGGGLPPSTKLIEPDSWYAERGLPVQQISRGRNLLHRILCGREQPQRRRAAVSFRRRAKRRRAFAPH